MNSVRSVRSFAGVLLLGGSALCAARAGAPAVFAGSTQMMVVTTPSWDAVEGQLQRWERAGTGQAWHPVGGAISIVVGSKGLAWGVGPIPPDARHLRLPGEPVKREGDGKSPAGVFSLGSAFGYAAQPLPGVKLAYLPLTPSTECVDDPASKHYNRIVDRSAVAPDWNSSEHMRAIGESYRWGIVMDFNGTVEGGSLPAPIPGAGSCVFLHIWHSRSQGTAGCTAMRQSDLESLMLWLDPARRPLVVQLPEPAYRRLARPWKLPRGPAGPTAH